jgi:hypothetical protein
MAGRHHNLGERLRGQTGAGKKSEINVKGKQHLRRQVDTERTIAA